MLKLWNIKLAAPASPRSNWSRFFAPSWSQRGKDKDAQFEMDAILESIVNIQSYVQQVNSGRKYDDQFDDTQFDYEIQDEIQSLQTNMRDLRLRDAIKGGSTASVAGEFGDLQRALTRLYANPMDEKALYYSQKLHARLNDALNARKTDADEEFNNWSRQPEMNMAPTTNPETSPIAPLASPEQVANGLRQIIGENGLNEIISILRTVQQGGVSPEIRGSINALIDALRIPNTQPNTQQEFNMDQPLDEPSAPESPPPPAGGAEVSEAPEAPFKPGVWNWDDRKEAFTSNKHTMKKVADVIEEYNIDLAKLLSDYFEEHKDQLPEFPQTSLILKEEMI